MPAARRAPARSRSSCEGALAHHAAAGEQHEAVAGAAGVGELMDREEQRAAARRLGAQSAIDLAGLTQVEPVERLVRAAGAAAARGARARAARACAPLGQRAARAAEQGAQLEGVGDARAARSAGTPQSRVKRARRRPAGRATARCRPARRTSPPSAPRGGSGAPPDRDLAARRRAARRRGIRTASSCRRRSDRSDPSTSPGRTVKLTVVQSTGAGRSSWRAPRTARRGSVSSF